jgi:hypothetical protein
MIIVLLIKINTFINFNYFLNREEIQNSEVKFVTSFLLQVWLFMKNIVRVTAVTDSSSNTSCDTTTPLLLSPSEGHSRLQRKGTTC